MDIIKHSNPNIFREANPYGKWLHNTFNWTHFATLRPYWKIYEHTGEKFMNNLKKYKAIQSVFYVIEPDEVNWKNYHIHMLIHSNLYMDREIFRKCLHSTKASKLINDFQEVKNNEAVSHYCSKRIGKGALAYNFYNRDIEV